MSLKKKSTRSPWFWVPTLYYAEGIPYIVVMTISVIMYKKMGISNTEIALYTSWLYLPWVIKPFWSPIVDIFRTKRFWIITMQLLIGAGLAAIGLTIPLPNFFKITLIIFWLLAFSSATHDIAADGFYMLGLTQHQQAWFVGVRSTFYRFAMLTGQGLLVILAGYIESSSGLQTVTLNVAAVQSQQQAAQMLSVEELDRRPHEGKLSILVAPQKLSIPIRTVEPAYVDSLLQVARQMNETQKMNSGARKTSLHPAGSQQPSWWHQHVASPLAKVIKQNFGVPKAPVSQRAGNIGIVYFWLSDKPEPGKEIVVNFGRKAGDKSISLLYGSRMVFTDRNWNKPVMAIIQIDPRLKHPTFAQFNATAGNIPLSWMITFFFMAALFLLFFIYHRFILPHPAEDTPRRTEDIRAFLSQFIKTFALFFKKDRIGIAIAFLLLYRLGEAQLVKLASPFLLDAQEAGGLSLTTGQVGFVYGTVGLLMLTIGGLLGGFVAARDGLKKWVWWMAIAINLPDAVYIYLAHALPDNFLIINLCVAVEQFGYGFGFTAYMLYMIYISEGEFKTAHFAITTGFMALGMMLPGMVSGWLQELIGYPHFFIWVLISTIPGFIIIKFLSLDPEFGKKRDQ